MGKGNDDIKLKKKHLRKIGAFKRQAAFFGFWENIFTAFAKILSVLALMSPLWAFFFIFMIQNENGNATFKSVFEAITEDSAHIGVYFLTVLLFLFVISIIRKPFARIAEGAKDEKYYSLNKMEAFLTENNINEKGEKQAIPWSEAVSGIFHRVTDADNIDAKTETFLVYDFRDILYAMLGTKNLLSREEREEIRNSWVNNV